MKQLKRNVLEKLAAYAKGAEYSSLLQKLIVQGLIKIEEQVVEIIARAEDKPIILRVVCLLRLFIFTN